MVGSDYLSIHFVISSCVADVADVADVVVVILDTVRFTGGKEVSAFVRFMRHLLTCLRNTSGKCWLWTKVAGS